MVDIERIRYAHFREGSSIRELARAFHHSRTTIRRALDDPGPWTYRRTRRRRVDRLLWIAGIAPSYVGERPVAWLPTPAEQDARYREFIEERKAS